MGRLIYIVLFFNMSFGLEGQIELFQIASGFSSPVALANADDGTNRLFVVERAGRIKIIDDLGTGSVLSTPFLDITGPVESGGERGLLGLTFHPDYPDTPHFYVNYTFRESGQLKTKVERYTVSTDSNVADPASALQILEVDQPYTNHNAGDIKFGPSDGYLYITMGDGGSGRDPDSLAQNTTNLLGSLLRIDVDKDDFPGDAESNYGIPPDNPFVGVGGYRGEFWAIGLRNPWRISFDRMTHDLWIADVGQSSLEEVSFQPSTSTGGENYGWSCREGTSVKNFNLCIPGPLTDPVFEYGRGDGYSITGGFVYRGAAFPALVGQYVVADYGSGNFWLVQSDNPSQSSKFFLIRDISTFGESESGELYAARLSTGVIYRIFDSSACSDLVDIVDHNQGTYSADSLITSDVPVESGTDVKYFSPEMDVDNPFEVKETGMFTAESISCMQHIQRTQN